MLRGSGNKQAGLAGHAQAVKASLQGCERHLGVQDFARDSNGQLRDSNGQLRNSQDTSFWNSLSTLGNDLFYSPDPSPAGQTKSAGEHPCLSHACVHPICNCASRISAPCLQFCLCVSMCG